MQRAVALKSSVTIKAIMPSSDYQALLPHLKALTVAAGREILSVYETDFAIKFKSDRSPVTSADLSADNLIHEGLRACAPEITVISEERFSQQEPLSIADAPFFLVDPLDGTRSFVQRNGEFTVNIALIENAKPVIGVVHVPVSGTTYWTDGMVAYRLCQGEAAPSSIQCRQPPPAGLTSISSRNHPDPRMRDYLDQFHIAETIVSGSSLKLCRIAEGAADLYPRFGRTMEWDTAAGHAILDAAGGVICTLDGSVLGYCKPGFCNPDFVAKGPGVQPASAQ